MWGHELKTNCSHCNMITVIVCLESRDDTAKRLDDVGIGYSDFNQSYDQCSNTVKLKHTQVAS